MDNGTAAATTRKRPSSAQVAVRDCPDGFAEFYVVHAPALRRMAIAMTRNPTDVDDLVQETFERALRNLASFQPGTNALAWLGTIMKRLFIDRCRRAGRLGASAVDPADRDLAAPEPELEPWWLSLTTADVKEALAELPQSWRELFESVALHGKSYKEVAVGEGLGISTIGSRLHRIRAKVRSALIRRNSTSASSCGHVGRGSEGLRHGPSRSGACVAADGADETHSG